MSGPPKTDSERMVWAAAYAAAYIALRRDKARIEPEREDGALATDAADEAWGALYQLRELASGDGEFAADARSMVTGESA